MRRIIANLANKDWGNLRKSGLTEETVEDNELRTKNNALVFPYRDLQGKVNGFVRTRPHKPRKDKDGKIVKYEQPLGVPSKAYFPAGSVTALRDDHGPIYITEGEKKALALDQEGFTAIGLGGVWCWKIKGTEELIDDLAAIDWSGRVVNIVFDYDEKAATRRHIDAARRRLAKVLRTAGAKTVRDVKLPPGPNGIKQGVDDFLVAHGVEAFHPLVERAGPVPEYKVTSLQKAEGRTDSANAARLIDAHRDILRWVGPWDKWLVWDERRWRLDDQLRIHSLAKVVAVGLWKEFADLIKAGTLNPMDSAAIFGFARSSSNVNGIKAMVDLARSETGVPIRVDELDSDPWLLNCNNGTIDLRTGKLREHRQSDFITKLAPVNYEPDATCPIWMGFLDTIFAGDHELIGYICRLVGYSITGVTREHILPFGYGTGANGKSTLFELLMGLLGSDYAMKAPPDLLMAKRGESHPTERADLHGKRFVACIETEAGRRMAEALVKELTGGDRVRARRMREDFWEFAPTHHVWLSGNYKPVVTGTDHGIWRRIKLIPFDVVIPDDQQDTELGDKLRGELSGILNWAIEGCLEWQKDGLKEPDIVRGATDEYRHESDDVGQFIEDYCELGQGYITPATRLYEVFTEATGIRMSQKQFGAELARRGFDNKRITRGPNKAKIGRKGLRLLEDVVSAEQVARATAEFEAKRKTRKGGRK